MGPKKPTCPPARAGGMGFRIYPTPPLRLPYARPRRSALRTYLARRRLVPSLYTRGGHLEQSLLQTRMSMCGRSSSSGPSRSNAAAAACSSRLR